MAQGGLFRMFNNVLNYRNILYNSTRITIAGNQQCAGIKEGLIQKVQDLNIPVKPKKPISAYFRYMADQRQVAMKKFPNLKLTDLTKKLAEEWNTISSSIKDEYTNRFKTEMESYKALLNDYNMKLTPVQKEGLELLIKAKKADKNRRINRKLNKEEHKPKRPVGPYMQYIMLTSKREGVKINEMLGAMKGKWAMLSDFEKDKYIQLFEVDKKRYEVEMKVWEAKMIIEGKLGLVRQKTQLASKPSLIKPNNEK